ncbi:hypothetical protein OM416_20410 [Paenibacillus sp. LS1]|uniref:hypothetical protein n=1 Tax=Paenibacillus sp. LS1 TaxID=2992120 RepID=UPI00222E6690|nr:hypothetical protein [Paenibacillus sp. LS1]MCW3793961.1 hypothetical protein [Paenibacillus sp. LS1]
MNNNQRKDNTLEISQWIIIGVVELGIQFEQSFDLIKRVYNDVWGTEIPDLKRVRIRSHERYKELQYKLERNELFSERDRHELIYLQIASSEISE